MGCDIHIRTEVKRYRSNDKERQNGVWICADKFVVNHDHILYGEEERYSVENEIYEDRNYRLFAVLAGVRNNYDVTPISPPRGLPVDASDETKQYHNSYGSDAHSESFLTLEELEQYQHWEHPIHGDLFKGTIDKLRNLTRQHSYPEYEIRADDVRIVFWFDN